MKIYNWGVSILALIIGVLYSNGAVNVNKENIEEYVKNNPTSVSEFIEDNFTKFVDEYNLSLDDSEEKWEAKYIENKFPILVNECGAEYEGIFLDFDFDNGYAIVGNDYTFLDFSTVGVSPYEGIVASEYYFSSAVGYYYLKDGNYLSINDENNADESIIYEEALSQPTYAGQTDKKTGCGEIRDTYAYVNDKYGDGWILERNNSLAMKSYRQWNYSVYRHNKIKNGIVSSSSEGNCWVVSAFHVLQYLAETKWTKMPKSYETEAYYPKVSEPNIYSLYYDSRGNNISNKLYVNNTTSNEFELIGSAFMWPKLYNQVRRHVDEKYKHIEDGMAWDTSEIIEYIANLYGYGVNAVEHYFWGFYTDTGTYKIDSGLPLIWSTTNDTYGCHSMAVCGYKYYYRTTGWWIFKITQYKLFYELRDGHNDTPRYYDMSGHFGFSVITSLEV